MQTIPVSISINKCHLLISHLLSCFLCVKRCHSVISRHNWGLVIYLFIYFAIEITELAMCYCRKKNAISFSFFLFFFNLTFHKAWSPLEDLLFSLPQDCLWSFLLWIMPVIFNYSNCHKFRFLILHERRNRSLFIPECLSLTIRIHINDVGVFSVYSYVLR